MKRSKEDLIPTISNCNYWIKIFTEDLEKAGNKIDECMSRGIDPITYVQWHDEVSDVQHDFIKFRQTHNCLLEGEPGYGPD